MTPEDLKFIQDNVPNATEEQIKQAFYDNQENMLETLSQLLKIEKKPVKEPTEWEKRRALCDEIDREAQQYFASKKSLKAGRS